MIYDDLIMFEMAYTQLADEKRALRKEQCLGQTDISYPAGGKHPLQKLDSIGIREHTIQTEVRGDA